VKKSCAASLVVWLACMALYGYLAWTRLDEIFPIAIIAILGGTFCAMLVAATIGLFTGSGDGAAVQRALAGEPMVDGRLEAASGPLRPLGEPMQAPFTGRPCVAYEYDVKPPGGGQSDFAGVALTPCVVDSSRGPVKLLGWALLDAFKKASRDDVDLARGAAYLRTAATEPLSIGRILQVFGELTSDDDGAIRKDYRTGEAEPSLDGKVIKEKIVAPDQPVTLLGIWNEAKGGFSPSGKANLNRIFPRDLANTGGKLGRDARKGFLTALVFFAVLHAILVPMYLLSPGKAKRDRQGQKISSDASVWDERDCDRLKDLLAAGADPNPRLQGRTALMNAAREGSVACVETLLRAGARIEDVDDSGDTALAEAVAAGREDTVAALKKAGAKDFRVTEAIGSPVTADSAPVAAVKSYLAALAAGDFDTMVRLKRNVSKERLEELRGDLPLWQSVRPATVESVEGWATDYTATVAVKGASALGPRTVHYHLEKAPDGWRIVREWLPD